VRGFVSDHDIEGHFRRLIQLVRESTLAELWDSLSLDALIFADLGWSDRTTDREIWKLCQADGLILITNNRNQQGDTSLEATIRSLSHSESLPVITIGNLERFQHERGYATRAAEELIAVAFDIRHYNHWLGSGRLFLPRE
jgi:predicted nuclease of predicted toxin-antitoxin system